MDDRRVREALAATGISAEAIAPLWPDVPDSPLVGALPGSSALQALTMCRKLLAPLDSIPILLGGGDALASMRNYPCYDPTEPTADILSRASIVDVDAFVAERLQEQDESGGIPRGAWPRDVAPSHDLVAHTNILKRTPHSRVYLAAIPLATAWAAPAVLRVGGWNDCPCPEEHAAVHRRWEPMFGATVVAVAHDIIECTVDRPPTTQEAAVALALEQYAYAPDVVDQGTQTIEALAAALLGGSTWYFWWD